MPERSSGTRLVPQAFFARDAPKSDAAIKALKVMTMTKILFLCVAAR